MTTPPLSDTDLVLKVLLSHKGDWVPKMYSTTGVMIHSRVADLRKRGCIIECRRFGQGDYRYRIAMCTATQHLMDRTVTARCELPLGHQGSHESPTASWPNLNERFEREGNRLSSDALAKSMADQPGDAT